MINDSRLVYKWFYLIHKVTYFLGIVGYMVVMCTLLGLYVLFLIRPETAMEFGIVVLFYGLYYGVLGRDFAEICADKMAAKMGVSVFKVSTVKYKKDTNHIGLQNAWTSTTMLWICGKIPELVENSLKNPSFLGIQITLIYKTHGHPQPRFEVEKSQNYKKIPWKILHFLGYFWNSWRAPGELPEFRDNSRNIVNCIQSLWKIKKR